MCLASELFQSTVVGLRAVQPKIGQIRQSGQNPCQGYRLLQNWNPFELIVLFGLSISLYCVVVYQQVLLPSFCILAACVVSKVFFVCQTVRICGVVMSLACSLSLFARSCTMNNQQVAGLSANHRLQELCIASAEHVLLHLYMSCGSEDVSGTSYIVQPLILAGFQYYDLHYVTVSVSLGAMTTQLQYHALSQMWTSAPVLATPPAVQQKWHHCW